MIMEKEIEENVNAADNNLSLEEAFNELDELTSRMQGGNLSLEEMFILYKKGVSLVEYCSRKIEKVECDIKVLEAGENK